MKREILLILLGSFGFLKNIQAQILKVMPGTDLTITAGTLFFADSITLQPTTDFTLSNNVLSRNSTVINYTANPYISRVYKFNTNTAAFTGTIRINYQDGAELNGIPELALTLNVHNGINWNHFTTSSSSTISNYVEASLNLVNLNELTLANTSRPLPLIWKSFTADKKQGQVLLNWSTSQELTTKDFTIQHSRDQNSWNDLMIIPANTNGSSTNNYQYVHTRPAEGNNYYRVLQSDRDGRSSYSNIRIVKFNTQLLTVLGNPVITDLITIRLSAGAKLSLYDAAGKLIWNKQFLPGVQTINVSGYAKGLYLMKADQSIQRILIK